MAYLLHALAFVAVIIAGSLTSALCVYVFGKIVGLI